MSNQSAMFAQSLKINGNDIDVNRIVSLAYTEYLDLSGPTIILQVRDEQSFIVDNYGLVAGTEIEIGMGDVHGIGDALFTETFTTMLYPVKNGVITIEAFQKDCYSIKTPASRSQFFTDKSPSEIISALIPGLKIQSNVNGKGVYHLNPGKTPSRLLRDMARDFAAACWICRGTVHFKLLSEIVATPAALTLGLNSKTCDVDIQRFNKINNSALFERVAYKNFSSWDTELGHQRSGVCQDKPLVVVAYPLTPVKLANQCVYIQPMLDVVVVGDTNFMPGINAGLDVIKLSHDAEIDESVPATLFIHSVTHYAQEMKYNNRMILGALNV